MVNKVRGFITAKPELADSDVDLIYAIWAWQLQQLKPSKKVSDLTAKELCQMWKSANISSPFNISRSRRKCQQHYPETRGRKYVTKQKGQDVVRSDVKRETDKANRVLSERPGESSITSA